MGKIEQKDYHLFFEEISLCLIKYGNLDPISARKIIENSTLLTLVKIMKIIFFSMNYHIIGRCSY